MKNNFFFFIFKEIFLKDNFYKKKIIYYLNTPFRTEELYFNDYYKKDAVNILDIGCRGDLPKEWKNIEKNFYGIDFNENEIIRLKEKYKKNNDLRFYFNKIIKRDNFNFESKRTLFNIMPFGKTSSEEIRHVLGVSNHYSSTENYEEFTIDNFIKKFIKKNKSINFLKIDIDSNDGEVLSGAIDLLNSKSLFGVKIECSFSKINTGRDFSDICNYLNKFGFVLHKILKSPHVSSKLHDYFLLNRPAQNFEGSEISGDLIFFKTLDQNYIKSLSKEEIIIFCKILEIFKLNSLAIEVLSKTNEIFEKSEKVAIQDLLTHSTSLKIYGKKYSYEEFMNKTNENSKILFNKDG